MANTKKLYFPYFSTGIVGLYATVLQTETGYYLDYADGVFKAFPGNPKTPLTENPVGSSVYYFADNRSAWADGKYLTFSYDATDFLFGGGEIFLLNDSEASTAVLLEYMELIKKIEEGNWELKEISGQAYWIYYDTNGVDVLMSFKCYDSNGNSALENIFKRVRA